MEVEIQVKKKVDISEYDFGRYEDVRTGGRINMMDIVNVRALSGLSREKVSAIIENYEALMKEYPNVRKE